MNPSIISLCKIGRLLVIIWWEGRVTLTRDALPSAAASLETSIGGNSQTQPAAQPGPFSIDTICTMCLPFPAIPDQDLQLKEMVAANLN